MSDVNVPISSWMDLEVRDGLTESESQLWLSTRDFHLRDLLCTRAVAAHYADEAVLKARGLHEDTSIDQFAHEATPVTEHPKLRDTPWSELSADERAYLTESENLKENYSRASGAYQAAKIESESLYGKMRRAQARIDAHAAKAPRL